MFAVQCNCKIFAFQGHYLSTFDKKQYRNTLKINPQNFFIRLINLRWRPFFRNFAIINLRGKNQTPSKRESSCPQKFFQLRSRDKAQSTKQSSKLCQDMQVSILFVIITFYSTKKVKFTYDAQNILFFLLCFNQALV